MTKLGDRLREYADRVDNDQYALGTDANALAIIFAGEHGYLLAATAVEGEEDRILMMLGLQIYQATNMKQSDASEQSK